ncbi:MAG: uracil-DNA glycosylase [Candidatus Diapherotrites archaeon]|nr:uracil-DNA glycosylase [Candidatus Diapherotrites archaeon]MDZ4256843.1 uracil-DNA glycosylase [archaeon]
MDTLSSLAAEAHTCTRCPLSRSRTLAVPGEGPSNATILLIGEAPGRNEDLHGRPFVGAAGKKLEGLLAQAGLAREDVFITSVVKCRPPENRVPTFEEATTCKIKFLQPQIHLIRPALIGLMGRTAISHVLGEKIDLETMHGKVLERNGQRYMILYHPAAMIYNQNLKAVMEKDFRELTPHGGEKHAFR